MSTNNTPFPTWRNQAERLTADRVRYVRFREPAQIPRYASMLKEELGKVRVEKDGGIM